MADVIRSPAPDDDPFLEFPSEREMVSGLTQRLRSRAPSAREPDERDTPEGPASIPDSLWQDDADSLITVPDQPTRADPVPIVRPVSRSELLLTPQPRAFPGPEPPTGSPEPEAEPDSAWGHLGDLTDQIRARASSRIIPRTNLREILMASAAVAVMLVLIAGYVLLTAEEPVDVPTVADTIPASNTTITSRPVGATVRIDGVNRGETPLELSLPVGEYQLEIQQDDETISLPLAVEPNTSVSAHVEIPDPPAVSAPLRPAAAPAVAPAPGWVEIEVPVTLVVNWSGRELGTTESGRFQLPVGHHQLTLTSEALEFKGVVDVSVVSNQTTTASLPLPKGTVSISAWPWAYVTVDGTPVGATPLGNLLLSIGDHEVIWTHPQLGERRQTVTVKALTPAQVGVDFTQ